MTPIPWGSEGTFWYIFCCAFLSFVCVCLEKQHSRRKQPSELLFLLLTEQIPGRKTGGKGKISLKVEREEQEARRKPSFGNVTGSSAKRKSHSGENPSPDLPGLLCYRLGVCSYKSNSTCRKKQNQNRPNPNSISSP